MSSVISTKVISDINDSRFNIQPCLVGINDSRFNIRPCHQWHQWHQPKPFQHPTMSSVTLVTSVLPAPFLSRNRESSRIIQTMNKYVIYVYQVHFVTHCGLLRSLCLMLSAIGCMGIKTRFARRRLSVLIMGLCLETVPIWSEMMVHRWKGEGWHR